jgi:hypothetical protein
MQPRRHHFAPTTVGAKNVKNDEVRYAACLPGVQPR